MTLAALIAVYLVHLAAAISPGPAVLMAARTSLSHGFARSAWLSVGLGLGACIWAVTALFGLTVLFRVAPALLVALKIGGAIYLLWLAFKIWRHAADGIEDDANLHQVRGRAALVRQGIAVQLANPKPAVFFGTIFLTLVPRDAPIWALAVILLMIFVNDAGWNMIVGRIFAFRRSRATYLNLKTVIDRVFGGLLALLGLKLATT